MTAARENVIHLPRTPEEKVNDDTASEISYASDKRAPDPTRSILNISEAWIADHAKHVTRMLPGGMFVMGKISF